MHKFLRKEEGGTQVYQKVVRSSIVCGSESWTLTSDKKRKRVATEMRSLGKVYGITKLDRRVRLTLLLV